MKPACWEACFLYPSPTVEHSNNCLLLLCRLFLEPSGHYTNFKEMLTVNTYTYSQPIEIPANYGKKISIALTIPDDYVFLCVTNIKTNEEVAYSYFTGIEQNVLTCFVGNDREVPKIIPNGISVDVLLIKKWR